MREFECMIPTAGECGLPEAWAVLLDAVLRTPLAYIAALEGTPVAEPELRSVTSAYTGRSPQPDRSQFQHFAVNRLARRAFVGHPPTEEERLTIPYGLHQFAKDVGVEYKRLEAACEVAMDYGWANATWCEGGTRPYRKRYFPTEDLLRSVRDPYLEYVIRILRLDEAAVLPWRAVPGEPPPFAHLHGLSAEDAAYVDAANKLPIAWKLLLKTVGADAPSREPVPQYPEVIWPPPSPADSTRKLLAQSELAYALVRQLVLFSAKPVSVESRSLAINKLARLPGLTEDRVQHQADLIVQHGWGERFPEEGLRATPSLIRDFGRFYVPGLRDELWPEVDDLLEGPAA